jgi:hypothetical protein
MLELIKRKTNSQSEYAKKKDKDQQPKPPRQQSSAANSNTEGTGASRPNAKRQRVAEPDADKHEPDAMKLLADAVISVTGPKDGSKSARPTHSAKLPIPHGQNTDHGILPKPFFDYTVKQYPIKKICIEFSLVVCLTAPPLFFVIMLVVAEGVG